MFKPRENQHVRHTMAQIQHVASLLAAPTVFIGLWTLIFIFYSQRGGLIRETKLPMQELELKLQGGRICGILQYY